jgi:glycosyltransferase involved in cell wall biosynthesis
MRGFANTVRARPGNESVAGHPDGTRGTSLEDHCVYSRTKMDAAWMNEDCCPDLVSVIVPTYNRAHLIVTTLDSVLQQAYRPVELIIVDDGSTDDSVEVIKRWMLRKKPGNEHLVNLRCIQQENAGPSAARNSGTRECSGEFIQFLDSDDILHPEKLARQVTAVRQNNADFCVCNYQTFTDNLTALGSVFDFYHRSHHVEDFPDQYPMDTPAPLYRRETICSNGPWDETLDAGEDFEYNFRVVARGAKGIWLDEVLLYVRKHDGPERRQATPLATRYQSMYLGLARMEMEAIERDVCTPRLLNSLGMRAYQYYQHMKAEGSLPQADVFRRFARPRLSWTTRANLFAKRVLPAPVTQLCVPVKRILRGRKR